MVLYLWVTPNIDLRFKKTVWSFLSEAFPQSFITPGSPLPPPPACGRCTLLSTVAHAWARSFFWVPQTGGSLLPCISVWACPWPAPPSSSLTSLIKEQWADFLPRGCIRKPPMKSTEIQQFLHGLKLTELETRCVSGKTEVGTRQPFLFLFLLLSGCPPSSQRHDGTLGTWMEHPSSQLQLALSLTKCSF